MAPSGIAAIPTATYENAMHLATRGSSYDDSNLGAAMPLETEYTDNIPLPSALLCSETSTASWPHEVMQLTGVGKGTDQDCCGAPRREAYEGADSAAAIWGGRLVRSGFGGAGFIYRLTEKLLVWRKCGHRPTCMNRSVVAAKCENMCENSARSTSSRVHARDRLAPSTARARASQP